MPNYITIDSGTTNTRISLVVNNEIIQTCTFEVGARKSIDNKFILKETIKHGIADLLKQNGLCEKDICCILACGMITSEFGLVELEHVKTPAGVRELHRQIYKCSLDEITSIPFAFIRGIKTECTCIESADMMRGEECELMGIFSGEGIYILPGSHSKMIKVDGDGRVVDIKTMLTGEMICAIAQGTILKEAVKISDFDIQKEYLIKGFEHTDKYGINEALFKVRMLKNFFTASESEIYNFYMGIMLHDEVKFILSQSPKKVFIGGRKGIKDATAILLGAFSDIKINVLSDTLVKNSTTMGMIRIFEEKEERRSECHEDYRC